MTIQNPLLIQSFTVGPTPEQVFVLSGDMHIFESSVVTVKVDGTGVNYTLSGGVLQASGTRKGGTITLVSSVTNATVTVTVDHPPHRLTNFADAEIDPSALDAEFDYGFAAMNDVQAQVDLSLRRPDASSNWDAEGFAIDNMGPGALTTSALTQAQIIALINAAAISGVTPSFTFENVLDAPYNADPTGVADSSQAFIDARNAALASGSNNVYVPAGTYRIDSGQVFNCNNGSQVTGFRWFGDGMECTKINLNSTDWAIYNDNNDQFVNYEGFSFFGDDTAKTSKFMYITAGGAGGNHAQSIRFTDCRWRFFDVIQDVQGTANASELVFNRCKISVGYATTSYLFRYANLQSVNHQFIATDIEVIDGDLWYFEQGGNLNVFGGSLIMLNGLGTTTGAVLRLNSQSNGIGKNNWQYNLEGVRTELFDDSQFLNMGLRGAARISLLNCHTENISGTAGRVIFDVGDGALIQVFGGTVSGRWHLNGDNGASWTGQHRPATVICKGVGLGEEHAVTRDTFNNRGGQGKFIIDDCKMHNQTWTPSPIHEPLDMQLGWEDGPNLSAAKPKVVALRSHVNLGGLPGRTETVTLKLPLGAVITKLRFWHPNQAGPQSQIYTLKNDDGTVTLRTYDVRIPEEHVWDDEIYYRCDTDNNRTLKFAGDAGNDTAFYQGHIEVNYIA